jgi:Secretion system C-terminal sorting domain/Beta-propeller repeat
MKLLFLLLVSSWSLNAQDFNYHRSWGTYFGDERFILQDSKVDSQGNLYIVGIVNSRDLITPIYSTPNTHQANYGGGLSDGFIAKFNTLGQLTWASYFGGEGNDAISGIDIDSNDNIYLLGYTDSHTNIATTGAFQTNIAGETDFFISQFSPNSTLVWSSYYGGGGFDGGSEFLSTSLLDSVDKRVHICHDKGNNFYIVGYSSSGNLGTSGTFQPLIGESNQIISKFDNTGTRVWTTYYNVITNYITAISATENEVYVRGKSADCSISHPPNSYCGTANGYQPLPRSCIDTFLSKFSSNGQRIWGTYYCGFSLATTNAVKTFQDKVYISGQAYNNLVTTPGAFQETSLNEFSSFLVQFNPNGTRNWGTYNGTNTGFPVNGGGGFATNISLDTMGNVYLSGVTILHSNIATTGAYQSGFTDDRSGFISKFDAEGNKIWGSYYGGNSFENDLMLHPYSRNFYLVGSTSSTDSMTTPNCLQPNFTIIDTENIGEYPQNIFIAHFEPNDLSTTTNELDAITLFPNPNTGNFTLQGNYTGDLAITIYDNQGRSVYSQETVSFQGKNTVAVASKLSSGIYFVKVFNDSVARTYKMIVK